SLSGNINNLTYLVSGNHLFNKAILNPRSFQRSSARTKLDLDLSDRLTIGTNIDYNYMRRNRRNDNNETSGRGIVGGALWFPSNLPVYQPDGSYTRCCFDDNPVASINEISRF